MTIKALAFALFPGSSPPVDKLLDQIEALLDEGEDRAGTGGQAMRWVGAEDLPVLRGIVAALRGPASVRQLAEPTAPSPVGEEALALAPEPVELLRAVWQSMYWGLAMQAPGPRR